MSRKKQKKDELLFTCSLGMVQDERVFIVNMENGDELYFELSPRGIESAAGMAILQLFPEMYAGAKKSRKMHTSAINHRSSK